MKQTPLHDAHRQLGARMAPFGGWDMPIQYEGILQEHEDTRRRATVFDTCHMGEFALSGPGAQADLERLLTQSVATIPAGRCRYGFLLRDDGGVLDDLTCYRFGPDRFMLVVNAGTLDRDREWIRSHLSSGTRFADTSEATAKLDVQGPLSRQAMEKAFQTPMPDLPYFGFAETPLAGVPCLVSRTGYTGEWGYELYFPADRAREFWDRLLAVGVKPAGLGARDTLRLEMGYPLYGHELTEDRTPAGASRGKYIDLTKDFIGGAAVAREIEGGTTALLAGLRLESRRAARAHDRVMKDGRAVGEVTSGSLAPSLGVAVALAYVAAPLAEVGTALAVESRGNLLPAAVTALPFYTEGTARRKTGA
ncbi:MAG TPA: glycine cleavage system aminomethyltransferase GcvT [Kiritimatiellia bacterium]|nr:glycine cleavage system aminomethyltransferase GcvT [Kiritimatiellia bacterium]HRZ11531.1 glycine cleavage system aminomethyltransferase GcvT [Kiritimatiellia bacterium]HSA16918.1 glycine cleavage system aminomethyltransferase GcvT [Kiritimatiellia bacterium]